MCVCGGTRNRGRACKLDTKLQVCNRQLHKAREMTSIHAHEVILQHKKTLILSSFYYFRGENKRGEENLCINLRCNFKDENRWLNFCFVYSAFAFPWKREINIPERRCCCCCATALLKLRKIYEKIAMKKKCDRKLWTKSCFLSPSYRSFEVRVSCAFTWREFHWWRDDEYESCKCTFWYAFRNFLSSPLLMATCDRWESHFYVVLILWYYFLFE